MGTSRTGGRRPVTETEQKALALMNEVRRERGLCDVSLENNRAGYSGVEALCRAIEQYDAFRQGVSDAVEEYFGPKHLDVILAGHSLARFITPKQVDPLVAALNDMKDGRAGPTTESYAACLRAAIEKRGYEIREKAGE